MSDDGTTWVLLHGSFHGGWCWSDVRNGLAAAGVTATAPSLPLTPGSDLLCHIGVVTEHVAALDAARVVLVGHSYAGMLLPAVASAAERVDRCVYADAFVPEAGETAFGLLGPMGAELEAMASADPDRCFPPPPAAMFGVEDEAISRRLADQLVPMPLETHAQPAPVSATAGGSWASAYVRFARVPMFEAHEARARAAGWPVVTIDADHEAMLTAPDELVAALLDLVGD